MYKDKKCIYTSYPEEYIDERFKVARHQLTNSSESFVLSVNKAGFDDAGMYMCRLVNNRTRRERCSILIVQIGNKYSSSCHSDSLYINYSDFELYRQM